MTSTGPHVIQMGKNLIENKMADSHWLKECMERGAKIVDIALEYDCPGSLPALGGEGNVRIRSMRVYVKTEFARLVGDAPTPRTT